MINIEIYLLTIAISQLNALSTTKHKDVTLKKQSLVCQYICVKKKSLNQFDNIVFVCSIPSLGSEDLDKVEPGLAITE